MKRICYVDKIIAYKNSNLISDEEALKMIHKHEETLEKQRKYKKGELIETLDQLVNQDFIYLNNKIYNRGWFLSWQLSFTNHLIIRKKLFKAIKKEQNNDTN